MGSSSPKSSLYRAIASGVARSPRAAWAGPPGRARGQANSRTESPRRIGISWRIRRTMKRSTRSGHLSGRGRPTAPLAESATGAAEEAGSVAEGHRREDLGGQRAGLETLHVLGDDERR